MYAKIYHIHTLVSVVFPSHKAVQQSFLWNVMQCLWQICLWAINSVNTTCFQKKITGSQVWEVRRLEENILIFDTKLAYWRNWASKLSWWIALLQFWSLFTTFFGYQTRNKFCCISMHAQLILLRSQPSPHMSCNTFNEFVGIKMIALILTSRIRKNRNEPDVGSREAEGDKSFGFCYKAGELTKLSEQAHWNCKLNLCFNIVAVKGCHIV